MILINFISVNSDKKNNKKLNMGHHVQYISLSIIF